MSLEDTSNTVGFPPSVSIFDDLEAELQRIFRLPRFRPLQREIVCALLAGERDVLAVLATGRGKSLCYQLPAQLLPGLTVVVSPLLALMRDQLQSLAELGLADSAALFSSSEQSASEQESVLQRALAGSLKLLYVAPESLPKLMDGPLAELYARGQLARFVVDEAHCILQWSDFRPHYAQLNRLRERFATVRIAAFTATASPEEQTRIAEALRIAPAAQLFAGTVNRPELHYAAIWLASSNSAASVALSQLNLRFTGGGGAAIVYCFSKKMCEKVAALLERNRPELETRVYHAGLSAGVRAQLSDQWRARELDVVCATVAFGMGIDRADVRLVLHVGMPSTLMRFAQESGRAGRDERPANSVLIYWTHNLQMLRGKAKETPPELQAMWDYCVANTCRRQLLFSDSPSSAARCCDNCDIARAPRQQTIQEAFRKKKK
jgi:ATP-dependent DNA helicase RecQ